MQTNVNLDRSSLSELVECIFKTGNPEVYLSDTVSKENTATLTSAPEVNASIDAAIKSNKKLIAFTIWYPDTHGHVEKRRLGLEMTKNEGRLNRHAISGWGIILFQLNFENPPLINCCVSCNSRKKAQTWSKGHSELKDPDLWDWDAVKQYCEQLVHLAESLKRKVVQFGDTPDL